MDIVCIQYLAMDSPNKRLTQQSLVYTYFKQIILDVLTFCTKLTNHNSFTIALLVLFDNVMKLYETVCTEI